MLKLSEVKRIEAAQDKKYKARQMAARILRKAFHDYAYAPYQSAIIKLSNGQALDLQEFNTIKNLAEKFGKPIPSNKLAIVKDAIMNSLRIRHFNQFGQELR